MNRRFRLTTSLRSESREQLIVQDGFLELTDQDAADTAFPHLEQPTHWNESESNDKERHPSSSVGSGLHGLCFAFILFSVNSIDYLIHLGVRKALISD